MSTFFTIYLIIFLFLSPYLIIRAVREYCKTQKEYGECFKLERKCKTKLPKEYRAVNRVQVEKIADVVCQELNISTIDDIILGPFVCGSGTAGLYRMYEGGITQLFVRGWGKFDIATLVHELTHHLEITRHFNQTHDAVFLKSEAEIFNLVEQLIAEQKI